MIWQNGRKYTRNTALVCLLLSLLALQSGTLFADSESGKKGKGEEKVIYKYKDYEKFEFDELDVNANKSGDGNLSITPREQIKFKNRLPLRKNFNPEIKDSVESIK